MAPRTLSADEIWAYIKNQKKVYVQHKEGEIQEVDDSVKEVEDGDDELEDSNNDVDDTYEKWTGCTARKW